MSALGDHLAAAVERHRRWCRDQGVAVPKELLTLVQAFREGQAGSSCGIAARVGEDPGMSLVVDYHEAARLLVCSVSTVKRLVRDGRLRSIAVGSARRIPRTEIQRYVDEQMKESA